MPRLASLDGAAEVAEGEGEEDGADGELPTEGRMAHAYGEGLAVLLSHLAAARRPQVQAWLQLKEDVVRSEAAALYDHHEQGWDDINDLEADFIVTSEQHRGKSWLVA